MTFRGRLRIFFTIIVIVPMIAVALVLFTLTAQSETGKADAGIASALRNAFAVYAENADRAAPALRRLAADGELRAALVADRPNEAAARLRELVRSNRRIVGAELYRPGGRLATRAGSADAIAPKSAPLTLSGGGSVGTLSVSVTDADRFAREVRRLSGFEVSVFRGGRRLASTVRGVEGAPERGAPDRSHDFELNGKDYRGRVDRIREPVGPPIEVAVFRRSDSLADAIADSRLLIGAILLAFLVLALASSVFVVRALQGQIGQFLDAARRLARGNFHESVPTEGRDEFAALGHEFNSMSEQLAAKIEEVERKRHELEETIRRVGAALGSGLDRQSVVELAVETAVDACDAEAGRALPVDPQAFNEARRGGVDGLSSALESAERRAFEVRPELGPELLDSRDDTGSERRRAVAGTTDGTHALAVPMRARLGSANTPQDLGVISVARRGRAFTRQEEELVEYLAAQAVISIENADLHDTVQRQAVTDELTGLSNIRELHAVLDREIERSRRFRSPLGLVMLDIDDFKQVNDEYGHQQGDEVLAAIASMLRDHSRDIDEPARYGGEELAVVLPQTDADGAAQVAERMKEALTRVRVPRVGGRGYLKVTASFGVASIPDSAVNKDSLISAADAALYRAKRAGKNRVERAEAVPASR